MKVLVSDCLLGINCKYNGKNNYSAKLEKFLKGKEYVSVCPEMRALNKCPRTPIELIDGIAYDKDGNNIDSLLNQAIEDIVKDLKDIDFAVLQSRSPTCGVNQIYDGTFQGVLIQGQGKLAKRLMELGIKVIDIEDLEE